MARNAWGSTRKLPSGRIQARYLGPDRKSYKAPETFPDKLSALAWLGEMRRTINLGSWEPPALKKVANGPGECSWAGLGREYRLLFVRHARVGLEKEFLALAFCSELAGALQPRFDSEPAVFSVPVGLTILDQDIQHG